MADPPHAPPERFPTLRVLLMPLAGVYGAAIAVRNRRFDRPGAALRAAVPVISVGNLTTGGTGKTPFVAMLVRRLMALGRTPAILTRGYGATAGQRADEVAEHEETLAVPVIVNPDRVAGAATATGEHGADCLVLDDGFQHRRLARDLDIVLIDALDPWGGGALLPAGRLREPVTSLSRAGLVVMTRANQVPADVLDTIRQRIERTTDAPVATSAVRAEQITFLDGRTAGPETLGFHSVLPVCGLGNPGTFLRLVQRWGGHVCAPLRFRDHHRYRASDRRRIAARARRDHADLVLTTRKDWGKLAPLWTEVRADGAPELARLDIALEMTDGADTLDRLLSELTGVPTKPRVLTWEPDDEESDCS